jgi:two-component system sensor histidine kinase ChvG
MSAPRSRKIVPQGRRRSSLRLRVVGAILFVALAPQLLVFLWSEADRNVPGKTWGFANDSAKEAATVLERGTLDEARLRAIARARRVRLRVLDASGEALLDDDEDRPEQGFDRVEEFFLGAQDLPTLEDLDQEQGPMIPRPEVQAALKTGHYIACGYVPLVLCQAIYRVTSPDGALFIVHVETTSRRSVRAVYGLRYQLLRLSLITAPLGLLLAVFTARRIVRPIEHLRRQALERAVAASPGSGLDAESPDEVGVLAGAFNALLLALDERRIANEAFVADLVHEMKTPVAAMRAAAESLEAGAVDHERAERLARVLKESTGKLDRLATQFLELARAEAGMPNEERSTVDLSPLLVAMVASMRDDPRHKGVRFEVTPSVGVPLTIRGVEHRLDALFRELLENAASFAGEGGTVTVLLEALPEDVRVAVRDSGPGIREEDLPRVFSRFFTTRGRQRGTGLGLALARAVAEAHGGTVVASSVAGDGATFEVRLPRA